MTVRLSRRRSRTWTRGTPSWPTALENLQDSRQRLELLEQLKGELSQVRARRGQGPARADPNATELEKSNEEVSVLFLDIAGYTRLSRAARGRG